MVPIGVSTLQGKSCTLQLFQRDLSRPGTLFSYRVAATQELSASRVSREARPYYLLSGDELPAISTDPLRQH